MADLVQKKDFVEIKYTGKEGSRVFDSNIEEDLKQISENEKPKKTIVAVGEKMLVYGLDKALEGKEIGKEYEIKLAPEEAFGIRDRNLVKTIPLRVFTEQKINPFPGQTLVLDNAVAKVIAISGARVLTDFNHPLSGKEIYYRFKIIRKVEDDKEKAESFFGFFFGVVPNFEINGKVVVSSPGEIKGLVEIFAEKFKELIGKELEFRETSGAEESEKKTAQ